MSSADATDKRLAWTVAPGTGAATISETGLLTATELGTVTVTATNAVSGVTGTAVITVTAVPLIAAYMDAADTAAIVDLLNGNELALTLTGYADLDEIGKTEVAAALYTTRATLTSKELIQSVVTVAIAAAKTASDARIVEAANAAIAAAKLALTADTIRGGNASLALVVTNLDLVTAGADGTTIAWSSDGDAIDTVTGAVYRPAYEDSSYNNATETLTATIAKDHGTPLTKAFDVRVLMNTSREDTRLLALNITGNTKVDEFDPDNNEFGFSVPYSILSTTISAIAMNAGATISGDVGEHELEVGDDTDFEIIVKSADGNDSKRYVFYIHRMTEEETVQAEAQEAAIATIEAYQGEEIDLVETLNTATQIPNESHEAIDRNIAAYKTGILAAADGELDTWGEIADFVYYVNDAAMQSAIAKIENVTASVTDAVYAITLDDLNYVSGGRAIEANLPAYRAAIVAAGDGELDTKSEISLMVTGINADVYAIAKIEAADDSYNNGILYNVINSAVNAEVAVPELNGVYWSAIVDAGNGELDTAEEIITMIENVNIAEIEAANPDCNTVNLYHLLNFITKMDTAVSEKNGFYWNSIYYAGDGALDTVEEIAAMVDSINNL